MIDDYWERTVFAAPPLAGLDRFDDSTAFDWIGLHFSTTGSKVDWSTVREGHSHWNFSDASELAASVVREVRRLATDESIVEHAGDGVSAYGVRFRGVDVPAVVAALLEIPEHHYFLATDRSWVVAVSFEGDLDIVDQHRLTQEGRSQPR
ncbi:hypothetical protein COUCH_15430 [Couchioplanes caeruleus]|uniref:hypothetical protein n=1 Tax=Couchioplanes caeruleus TaxID=56438 RepID=UPI0020BE04C6|nr:hypothetical protein [Couchioplanes caeruleus]UQU67573.1 hypothetical protein COUCH_15430 [Couchioplanes caeruleus]